MAGASRAAVAIYLRDEKDVARAAQVMKGWLGERSAYPGISAPDFGPEDVGKWLRFGGYNDGLSWQADPSKPVGVDPKGLPTTVIRSTPPCRTTCDAADLFGGHLDTRGILGKR